MPPSEPARVEVRAVVQVVDHRANRHLVVGPQLQLQADGAVARAVEREGGDLAGDDVLRQVEELLFGRVAAGDQHDERRAIDALGTAQVARKQRALEGHLEQLHRWGRERGRQAPALVHLGERCAELVGAVREEEARPVEEEAGADVVKAGRAGVAGGERLVAELAVTGSPVAVHPAPVVEGLDLPLHPLEVPVRHVVRGDPPGEEAVHRLEVGVSHRPAPSPPGRQPRPSRDSPCSGRGCPPGPP